MLSRKRYAPVVSFPSCFFPFDTLLLGFLFRLCEAARSLRGRVRHASFSEATGQAWPHRWHRVQDHLSFDADIQFGLKRCVRMSAASFWTGSELYFVFQMSEQSPMGLAFPRRTPFQQSSWRRSRLTWKTHLEYLIQVLGSWESSSKAAAADYRSCDEGGGRGCR